jgi:hypothetical protein
MKLQCSSRLSDWIDAHLQLYLPAIPGCDLDLKYGPDPLSDTALCQRTHVLGGLAGKEIEHIQAPRFSARVTNQPFARRVDKFEVTGDVDCENDDDFVSQKPLATDFLVKTTSHVLGARSLDATAAALGIFAATRLIWDVQKGPVLHSTSARCRAGLLIVNGNRVFRDSGFCLCIKYASKNCLAKSRHSTSSVTAHRLLFASPSAGEIRVSFEATSDGCIQRGATQDLV